MKFTPAILLIMATANLSWAQQPAQKNLTKSIKPLITKYCLECHSADDPSGGVELDQLSDKLAQGEDAEAWHAALDMINSGDMPPEDADQPSKEEREQIVNWITTSLARAADAKKGTQKTSVRRLTRNQYTNTLQDLLGVQIDFGKTLPADSKSEMGFTNNGEVLQTSSLHLDYYEKIARTALGKAIVTGDRPESVHYRVTFGAKIDGQTGTEIGGFQSKAIRKSDFVVQRLGKPNRPPEKIEPSPSEQSQKNKDRKARRARRKKRRDKQNDQAVAIDDDRRNAIGVGMRGSDADRFRVTQDGLVLFSAVPHVETTPKSWQGPSPNAKLLFQNSFPKEGDILVRVKAARSSNFTANRKGFISLREKSVATQTDQSIRLKAADCKDLKRLVLKDGKWLIPETIENGANANFKLDIPESGVYQFDIVHPYVDPNSMPSLRLKVDGEKVQQRLQIPESLKDTAEITHPITLAYLGKGAHQISIGGSFFVGFKELIITPQKDIAKELGNEVGINQTTYESQTPSLRVFAGTRTDDGMDYRTFDSSKVVDGDFGEMQTIEFKGRLEDLPLPYFDEVSNDELGKITVIGLWNDYLVKSRSNSGPPVVVESIEVEAPYIPQWPPKTHQQIFFETEDDANAYGSDPYTREVLVRFTNRAFRTRLADEEIDRYFDFWKSIKTDHPTYEDSVKEVLVAVLCSPKFLYLIEPAKTDDQFQLASRLSYFLWNSPPDAKTLELAATGTLKKSLRSEVQRLVDSPNTRNMIESFAYDWLRIDRHETMQVNVERYPAFTRFVKADMQQETYHFLDHLLQNNLSIDNMIESDFAMLNQNLAEFYSIEGVKGNHFRPVEVPPAANRGGLLSQGAFLTGHSDGTDAHPIKRAVWLKEKILGDPPPPPPPNVPELDPDTPGFDKLTLKEKLELHRDKDSCRSCHQKIDPYGVVFESFDATGRFNPTRNQKPIDVSSTLPDGTKIDGVAEIKEYILKHQRREFATAFVEHLFAYALGRDVTYADEAEIADIVARAEKRGNGLRTIVEEIVLSPSFAGKQ